MKRPFPVYLLVMLLAIQSLGGLFGGIALVLSPSGAILRLPVSTLDGSPFTDFLIPGLILLFLLGVLPGILVYALIAKPGWKFFGIFNIYHGIHWAWTYSLYLGIMLVIWILMEIIWIEYDILQTIYGMIGVVIMILCLLPATMKHYGWRRSED
ncbi:MAG TPA: hypothetical protein PKN44_04745 [Bacteroidales bacterium]|nr:hypothetical protein [Bacteroidales bacterium]